MLPLVVRIQKEDGHKQEYAFLDSPVRIGRSPLNHIRLTEEYISRIQAVVRFDRDEINYFNVGQTNVTTVDGREINANEEIKVEAVNMITVGTLRMQFVREAVAEEKISRQGGIRTRSSSVPEYRDLEKTIAVDIPPSIPPPSPSLATSLDTTPSVIVNVEATPSTNIGSKHGRGTSVAAAKIIPISQNPPAVAHPRPASLPTIGYAGDVRVPPVSRDLKSRAEPAAALPVSVPQLSKPAETASHYQAFRQAWSGLYQALKLQLDSATDAERPRLAESLQKQFPQIVREPEFRKLLKAMGLTPRKLENPEIEEWLIALGKGLFPKGVSLTSGMSFERIGKVLEVFSQVFVEIQAAQNEARKQMALQTPGTSSLLSSEDPGVILAYLLNPAADSEQRLMELEQCITKLALHETALFGAIKDGAFELLQSISPESIANEENSSNKEDEGGGVFERFLVSQEDLQAARLWRRYEAMHENLMDGKYYQRRFVGREFARIYLRAMEKLLPDS
jgi:hypothetical protein